MYSINRQVAIIKPKKPYIEWINSLPGTDQPVESEFLEKDCTAYLLPDLYDDEESLEYLKKFYQPVFELELDSWCTDKNYWPGKRTFNLFLKWFKVEFHSEVLDLVNYGIVKEEY